MGNICRTDQRTNKTARGLWFQSHVCTGFRPEGNTHMYGCLLGQWDVGDFPPIIPRIRLFCNKHVGNVEWASPTSYVACVKTSRRTALQTDVSLQARAHFSQSRQDPAIGHPLPVTRLCKPSLPAPHLFSLPCFPWKVPPHTHHKHQQPSRLSSDVTRPEFPTLLYPSRVSALCCGIFPLCLTVP